MSIAPVGNVVCCSCCRDPGLWYRKQSSSMDCGWTKATGAGNAHISRQCPRSLGQDCWVCTLPI